MLACLNKKVANITKSRQMVVKNTFSCAKLLTRIARTVRSQSYLRNISFHYVKKIDQIAQISFLEWRGDRTDGLLRWVMSCKLLMTNASKPFFAGTLNSPRVIFHDSIGGRQHEPLISLTLNACHVTMIYLLPTNIFAGYIGVRWVCSVRTWLCSSVWTGRQVTEASIIATAWNERPSTVHTSSRPSPISLDMSQSSFSDENLASTLSYDACHLQDVLSLWHMDALS